MNKSMDNKESVIADASASDYLKHARRINGIARTLLRLETRDSDWLDAKISLGLSLQAAELAGKGILRALGNSVGDIRDNHRRHDLLSLLRQVERKLQSRPEEALSRHHNFLLRTPQIDGEHYATTIGEYLSSHFSRGASAQPRSYFYPDFHIFTGPQPIHGLLAMVDDIIAVCEEVIAATAKAEER